MGFLDGGLGSSLTPQELQVLEAMMKQQGSVPQGAPYNNPNFTMPGQGPTFSPNVLSGEGMMPPVSGNLPTVYRQPNVPALIPQPTPAAQALGGPALPPPIAPIAGDAATAAPAAASAVGDAASPGLISQALGIARTGLGTAGTVGRVAGVPAILAGTAMHYGQNPLSPDEAANPGVSNPSSEDTGLDSAEKTIQRGAVRGINATGNAIKGAYDWFATPGSGKDSGVGAPGGPVTLKGGKSSLPTIDDAIGLSSTTSGVQKMGAGGTVSQALSGSGTPRNANLDFLEQQMEKNQPWKYPGEAAYKQQGEEAISAGAGEGLLKAAGYGLKPSVRALLGAGTGAAEKDIEFKQGQAALAMKAAENQVDWAKDAAKTGSDLEKEQRSEADSMTKVHMNRWGAIVEQGTYDKDGNLHKTLVPLDNAISGAKSQLLATSFLGKESKTNPLDPHAKELVLLDQLDKSGQLIPILNKYPALLQTADQEALKVAGTTSGADREKINYDARRGIVLQAMTSNPEFRQDLINHMAAIRNASGQHQGILPLASESDASKALAGPDASGAPEGDEEQDSTSIIANDPGAQR